MTIHKQTLTAADEFELVAYNNSRPFASFLPGIAGEYGKPLWVFYTNRGQCISSFGVRDRNGAMLEFQAADKAYALTSLFGFRTFFKLANDSSQPLYEPFQTGTEAGVTRRLTIRPEEIEIEEIHTRLGLRIRVNYFTLPNESLPALVRRVTLENTGATLLKAEVLDGMPQVVPYGLEENLLKQMSRTMQAFAEIRHVEESLPFYKLKVMPSDKPEMEWINAGFFAFTLHHEQPVAVIVDPEQVFGLDTSLRTPEAFLGSGHIDSLAGRRDTLTGCAFANLALALEAGASTTWDSYFGQTPDWETANAFRERLVGNTGYAKAKRAENRALISSLSSQFDLVAGPPQLGPYTRQAFLDNTLRGGQPVVIESTNGPRVFHVFTRKHGDMERDYNFFNVAPTYFSQGNGNFRDVNQNRRSENYIFPGIDTANIETFFNLIQIDGNNPLVVQSEKFRVPAQQIQTWAPANTPEWHTFLSRPFSPGQLMQALLDSLGTIEVAQPIFKRILGQSELVQDASHGEGYWVDHWIYNLDLLESYAGLYPDRLRSLLVERCDFTYFDNDHIVQPRAKKTVLRKDGTVRQLNAVVKDIDKAQLIAKRSEARNLMRSAHGLGPVYRTTLLAKLLNLLAIKTSLLDPFGIGLEMETDKPGWCDALNGLPGLFGSSTHEAFALRRGIAFARSAVNDNLLSFPKCMTLLPQTPSLTLPLGERGLNPLGSGEGLNPLHPGEGREGVNLSTIIETSILPDGSLLVPQEVAHLISALTLILTQADTENFFPTWQQLSTLRENFRAQTRLGVAGEEASLSANEILKFLEVADKILQQGLSKAIGENKLPISYYIHNVESYEILTEAIAPKTDESAASVVYVKVTRFSQKPVSNFLEGAVHALRGTANSASAERLYRAVRRSSLYDEKLGMYRVNCPLDKESFEIGRSRIFSPGWLENESIFLHMHYKFLLETLRGGLAKEFFDDLQRGLVAFQRAETYGRSPLENSSFIASSRFPDTKAHGVGFVSRLSGATAEWLSMVLHMGLGATPFRIVERALRFEPQPTLAEWLFTRDAGDNFGANSFGFKLFGRTWVVYENPTRHATFGRDAVAPVSFDLHYNDGRRQTHRGQWLPEDMALNLREYQLSKLVIFLG